MAQQIWQRWFIFVACVTLLGYATATRVEAAALSDNQPSSISQDHQPTAPAYSLHLPLLNNDNENNEESGPFIAVSTGAAHTCALVKGGAAYCWGEGSRGQLGIGSPPSYPVATPTAVNELISGLKAIATGYAQTCALREDGRVSCWGNYYDNEFTGSTGLTSPREIAGLATQANAIAVGADHACALLITGGVQCWGQNMLGQLGTGTTEANAGPVNVLGLAQGVSAIAANRDRTCALLDDGTVQCWGEYSTNRSTENLRSLTPDAITGLAGKAKAVAVGYGYSCALLENGSIQCWGSNEYGQLGNGNTTASTMPVTVQGLADRAVAITAGAGQSCALLENGIVQCWGRNDKRQAGVDSDENVLSPVSISGLSGKIVRIAAGGAHTCARSESGIIRCWGHAALGALGDGNGVFRLDPRLIEGYEAGVESIAVGDFHACALMQSGVSCFGYNLSGELGKDKSEAQPKPSPIDELTEEIVSLDSGSGHSCVLLTNGTVQCWGDNSQGQLGSSTPLTSSIPIQVEALNEKVTSIAVSGAYGCAIYISGSVQCWGDDQSTFVAFPLFEGGVTQISAGYDNACALFEDNTVQCWGSTLLPVHEINGLAGEVKTLASSWTASCALLVNGTVQCWDSSPGSPPVTIGGPDGKFIAISGGGYDFCALLENGGVQCWPSTSIRALSQGRTEDSSVQEYSQSSNYIIAPGSDVKAISVGLALSCALWDGGAVRCWGNNDIIAPWRSTPTQVIWP